MIGVASNLLASWVGQRFGGAGGCDAMSSGRRRGPEEFDPTQPLVATGNLRRRHLVSRFAQGLAIAAAVAAVAVLVIVIWSRSSATASRRSTGTSSPAANRKGSARTWSGPAIIVGIAHPDRDADRRPDRALPQRVRRAARRPAPVQLLMDVMNGLPSIIIAVFIYILIVEPTKQQSGLRGRRSRWRSSRCR